MLGASSAHGLDGHLGVGHGSLARGKENPGVLVCFSGTAGPCRMATHTPGSVRATCSGGRYPCHSRRWKWMGFKVSSNPNYFVIL